MSVILVLLLFALVAGSVVALSASLRRPRKVAVLLGAVSATVAVAAADVTHDWIILAVPIAGIFASTLEWRAGSRLRRVVATGLIAFAVACAAMPLALFFVLFLGYGLGL